jgi:hypothetical protein
MAAAILAVCILPATAQAIEFTLFFGQPSGGELGQFGYNVRSAGDLNNDGYPDIVAGAPFDNTVGQNAGRAFVWFGGPEMTGQPDLILDDSNGFDYFGFAVAGVGDLDGDGYDDLAGDRFGWSIAGAGDMNRDSRDDMVVGAPYNDALGKDVGRAYVFVGASSVSSMGPDPDVIWSGEAGGGPTNSTNFTNFAPDGQPIDGPGFGYSVANLFDFRGDSRAAVAVGAPGQNGATGRAYLFIAASSSNQLPASTAHVTFTNNVSNEEFGWSVANGGYINSGSQADLEFDLGRGELRELRAIAGHFGLSLRFRGRRGGRRRWRRR